MMFRALHGFAVSTIKVKNFSRESAAPGPLLLEYAIVPRQFFADGVNIPMPSSALN